MAGQRHAVLLALALGIIVALSSTAAAKEEEEEEAHIRLYWHDAVRGPTPTTVRVAHAAGADKLDLSFGSVFVMDDALTEGPEASSKLVGLAQGMYVSAGKDSVALLMAMNFVFLDGPYNGSCIAIMGRNDVFSGVREMAVVGGSGVFRWARGYAQARTHTLDRKTGDATVEYTVFVRH